VTDNPTDHGADRGRHGAPSSAAELIADYTSGHRAHDGAATGPVSWFARRY